jgi:glycosidase
VSVWSQFPLVYEINARVWLRELSRKLGQPITLANVPEEEFEMWRDYHFDAIWLMGVWQPSTYSRELALANKAWVQHFVEVVDGWCPEDVLSSPYSVADYGVAESLGGDTGLEMFRNRLRSLSMRLILDFVPNHTAVEHRWVKTNPEFYISLADERLAGMDRNSCFSPGNGVNFACGRLLNSPLWTDTVQLNVSKPEVQEALVNTLHSISARCDGVRCDTAIAVVKEIFNSTWEGLIDPMCTEFWPTAIAEVRNAAPEFLFIAEVFGEREWQLQQFGFDFTYDKPLYDRLASNDISGTKQHLLADWEFTRKLARFTENHDWERAVEVFGLNHRAASLLMLTIPGLRLLHQGQLQGYRQTVSVYLRRLPSELEDQEVVAFYDRLLRVMDNRAIQKGDFQMLDVVNANEAVIGFERTDAELGRTISLLNFSEANAEVSFATDDFAQIEDYRQVRVVSTELYRSPQFDLWPGGITARRFEHVRSITVLPDVSYKYNIP